MGWINTVVRFLISVKWLDANMLSVKRLRDIYNIHPRIASIIDKDCKDTEAVRSIANEGYWKGYIDGVNDVKAVKVCKKCTKIINKEFVGEYTLKLNKDGSININNPRNPLMSDDGMHGDPFTPLKWQ